jgi:divalent metal cation (Fe/Co/Zn/Cd) transporter
MDFGRYLAIAITVVAFMFGLWILLQVLGVVTSGLNTATNNITDNVVSIVGVSSVNGSGVVYTVHNATGMDASAIFSPAINYAQDFASVFAIVIIIGLVVGFIWTRRR